MPQVWADSLFPGVWTLPNGETFQCDVPDVRYYQQRFKDMIAAGAPVPVSWEHQPSVGLSASDRLAMQAKHVVGHCHDARIGAQGQLQILLDADPEDVPRLKRNKFVSPEIRQNVVDTRTGKRWGGPSIAHLAITPRPVQTPSRADWAPHIRLSQAPAVSLRAVSVDVSLSQASYAKPKAAKDDPMPLPPKKPDDKPKAEDKPEDATAPEETEATPPAADPAAPPPTDESAGLDGGGNVAPGDDAMQMSKVIEALHAHGLMVGEDTTKDNLPERILVATQTKMAAEGAAGEGEQQTPTQEPEVADSMPIMMSQADGTTVQLSQAQFDAIKAKADRSDKLERDNLANRVRVLHANGYVNDKIRDDMLGRLKTVSLSAGQSLADCPVAVEVAAYERLMGSGVAGMFPRPNAKKGKPNPDKPISSAVALSQGEHVVSPPYQEDDGTDGPSRKECEAAGDDLARFATGSCK